MRRLLFIPLLVLCAACPRDKKPTAAQSGVPVDSSALATLDTNPADLSGVHAALPPAAPDTFTQRHLPSARGTTSSSAGSVSYPEAPAALMNAVAREEAFTRFCYQEFGQKADPSLTGGVAMIVTVANAGISDVRVGNSRWTSSAGNAVNRCLNDRAKTAWKLAPGAVSAGKYIVPLVFRGG